MEIGTYLTQITPNQKEIDNNINHPAKFTRFTLTQTIKQNLQIENIKKINTVNRKSNANCFLPEEYYLVKKIKPGMAFYKDILQAQFKRNSQNKMPSLNLNMPQTLVFQQNSISLIYSQNGVIKVNQHVNYRQFLKIVQNTELFVQKQKKDVQVKNKNDNLLYPTLLSGIGNGIATDFSVTLSNELDIKIMPRNQNQVSIKFIQPLGKCPNMLRLFYNPKSIKGSKPNYAYKAINKKKIDEQTITRKHKQTHNYIVDFNKQESIITTVINGKALKEVEMMTQSLIDYLEYNKQSKIMEIVVDFIFGHDRLYYFHEIKSIKSVAINSVWNIGTPAQIQQRYKQQNNQIYCRLCGYFFPKIQITKLVTNKLIIELISHLKARGEKINLTTNCKTSNLSGSTNVCDLCYQLVVAEHQLINIEQQFCSLINSSSDSLNRVRQINGNHIPLFCHELTTMMQWRVFFYIEKIKNIPYELTEFDNTISLNMKFNDVKQSFSKTLEPSQFNFQQSRVFSGKTSFVRCSSGKSFRGLTPKGQKKPTSHTTCTNRSYDHYRQNSTIDFQKVKIITFYTKNDEIKSTLSNEEVSFEFIYNNYKLKGQTSTLQNFGNTKQCQRYSCQVLLFDEKYTYCNLQLNVGLICDGPVSTASLSLAKSHNSNIYLSTGKSETCSPLPAEWMQIISEGIDTCQQSPNIEKRNKVNNFRVQSGHIMRTGIKNNRVSNPKIEEIQQKQQYL